MKALSLWQPWASAIAVGAKRIETRHWKTDYRGPLLIHASKNTCCLPYKRGIGFPGPFDNNWAGKMAMDAAGISYTYDFPLGAIIAVAELVDCLRITVPDGGALPLLACDSINHVFSMPSGQELILGDFTPGRFGWVLSNVRALPNPISYTGRQGLFDVPVDVLPEEFSR